ncbi:MAG: hypothetical protein FWE11_01925 [Defluviitaleaceae bacterium]|nr:hypothetical protein [Defluviitaleaceae bacterium]
MRDAENTDTDKIGETNPLNKAKEYKFHTLTPKNDADLEVYQPALDFVFSKSDIKNIAISGAYGAGKSSVIESYKEKNPDKNFLHISLTCFRPESENNTTFEQEQSETKDATSPEAEDTMTNGDIETPSISDTVLKGKILNQLIHQIPSTDIPLSNFRIKKATSKSKNIRAALLAVLGISLGVFVIYFHRWNNFVNSIETPWLNSVLSLSVCSEVRLAALIGFFILVGLFAYNIIKLQETHRFIRKATVSGVEVELFEENADLYFDKYLNEILYLFEGRNGAIVFEDIDRYDTGHIFEWLHEINRLVNNGRKDNPLRFFYLLKDDIFVSKDRTKFFDFIMPVVPIVDGSNSFDIFLESFETVGIKIDDKTKGKLSNEFLQGISLYIDDMRLLQNICNEFSIYNGRLNITEQDENKMFAIIAYKNIFPRDFADLQLAKGFMFEIIGGRGKDTLIGVELLRINNSITSKAEELKRVKSEFLVSDELAIIYGQKMFGIQHHHRNWTADTYREQIEAQSGYDDIKAEYDARIAHAADSSESKENRIIRIEREILELNKEKSLLVEKLVRSLLTRDNIDGFFRDAVFISETGKKEYFKGIKDSPYFEMLKFLVREGYIDEAYSDYMTYFREKSIKRTDKIFLRSVTDKVAKEKSYKLENPDLIASRLPLMYFDQEEVLNFDLFKFLLSDYLSGEKYLSKTKRLIKYIRDNELHDFVMDYALYTPTLDDFVKVIGLEWIEFLADYFSYYKIKGAPTGAGSTNDDFIRYFALTLLIQIGTNPEWLSLTVDEKVSYTVEPSTRLLSEYVSKDNIFLRTKTPFVQELSAGIKRLIIRINSVQLDFAKNAEKMEDRANYFEYDVIQDELLKMIYENNSYEINYNNVLVMLESFYDSPNISIVPTAGYSIVMSDKKSPLAKYINDPPFENIGKYVDVILEHCGEVITDEEENALLIINNEDVSEDKRATYISYLTTVITDIREIINHKLWAEMLKNHKALKYTAENIMTYYINYCDKIFDDVLVEYINANGVSIVFGNVFADEEQKKVFFRALIRSCSLNNAVYEGYLSQFIWKYDNFAIEGLTIEKLSIIDKLKKIGMSLTSLTTLREHYAEYLLNFICSHIADYFKIAHEDGVFVFDEMLELLDREISTEHKIELANYTDETISVKGKKYPDELIAYIVSGVNFHNSDFEYLIDNYDKLGQASKKEVLSRATQEISLLQAIIDKATPSLIDGVFSSNQVDIAEKHEILKAIATKAKIYNLQQWLKMVNLDFFMEIYDKNKRPKFENTDINATMLEIFKERREITDYELDEVINKFKIKRGGLFSGIADNLL